MNALLDSYLIHKFWNKFYFPPKSKIYANQFYHFEVLKTLNEFLSKYFI